MRPGRDKRPGQVPEPNRFDGDVRLFALGGTDWRPLEPSAGYAGAGRRIDLTTTVDFCRVRQKYRRNMPIFRLNLRLAFASWPR